MCIFKGLSIGAAIFAVTGIINLFSIPEAVAQEEKARLEYELEPMTVTAEKREENIQEVPVSITALSATQIEDSGITSIYDVALQIPNLHVITPGQRVNQNIYIRGIGSPGGLLEPAVGFYVDDVSYSSDLSFGTELFDIERIEVLRGPQGTLYGRNTLAGVINIITRKPKNYIEGSASVGYGNYDRQDYRAVLRAPVVKDKLFFGISGVKSTRDGYTDNTYLGTEPDDRDGLSGRAHLRWMPVDALDITLSASADRYRDGTWPLAPIEELRKDPHKVSYNCDGYDDYDANDQALRVVYEGPSFKLTSITARRDYKFDDMTDVDYSPADSMLYYHTNDQNQWTQEIRIQSPKDSGALKWLVDAFYFDGKMDSDIRTDFCQGFPPWIPPFKQFQNNTIDTQSYALFGQTTYAVLEKLGFTAGLRYDHEEKELDWKQYYDQDMSAWEALGMVPPSGDLNADDDWEEWLPKFGIDYQWTPDLMTYASVARGYKSGGFNPSAMDPAYISYEPEYSWNYELGMKSSWLDKRLTLNAAAFYIEWKDQQIWQVLSMNEWRVENAAESYSRGFELELITKPMRGLELIAGFGYTDAEFEDCKMKQINPFTGIPYIEDNEGNRPPQVPEYTYNVSAQYRHPLTGSTNLFGRADLQGIGNQYWDAANTQKEDAYQMVNVRLGFEGEHFDIYLWGKNLFDEVYVTKAIPTQGGAGPWYGHAGDPQTFGITVTGRF